MEISFGVESFACNRRRGLFFREFSHIDWATGIAYRALGLGVTCSTRVEFIRTTSSGMTTTTALSARL